MNIRTFTRLVSPVLLALAAYAPATYAQTQITGSFVVSAHIDPGCTAITPAPLAFLDFTGSAKNANSSISVTCTSGTLYKVGLGAGNCSVANRCMKSGPTNSLSYNLYTDSAHTHIWPALGDPTTPSWSAGTHTFTVYGHIPAVSPLPPTGDYSDTIQVTVEY